MHGTGHVLREMRGRCTAQGTGGTPVVCRAPSRTRRFGGRRSAAPRPERRRTQRPPSPSGRLPQRSGARVSLQTRHMQRPAHRRPRHRGTAQRPGVPPPESPPGPHIPGARLLRTAAPLHHRTVAGSVGGPFPWPRALEDPMTRPPPPPPRRPCASPAGGGGSGTQTFVYQKWPDQIFPTANVVVSPDGVRCAACNADAAGRAPRGHCTARGWRAVWGPWGAGRRCGAPRRRGRRCGAVRCGAVRCGAAHSDALPRSAPVHYVCIADNHVSGRLVEFVARCSTSGVTKH